MKPEEYLAQTETLYSSFTGVLTQLHHLADVNTPPNHCEASELRSVISESCIHLSALTKILVEHRQTVKSLRLRREQIASVIKNAKKIIHPIRSLPNEILCLIFSECLDSDARASDSLPVKQAPWTLSYVCSRWRRLVTSYPSLWTTLCFDYTSFGAYRNHHVLYLLTLCLERSRALPLNVTLRVITDRIGHKLMRDIIQATAGRWKSLVLDLPLSEIMRFNECSLPLLESLKLRDCQSDMGSGWYMVKMFSSAPLLQSITVASESSLALQMFQMPWRSQIVEYNCEHDMFSTDNLDVLRQLTSLRYLVAHVVVGSSLEAVEPLALPLLTHLKLSVAGATAPEGINLSAYLGFLRMPLLNELTLNYCETDALCPVSSHTDFGSVKTLRVHMNLSSIDAGNLVHFLSFMGGVEEMELSGHIISDQLLQALTPTDDGTILVPRLRILDTHNASFGLAFDGGDPVPHIQAFHHMLLSRSQAHERLIFTLEKLVATRTTTWRCGDHQTVELRENSKPLVRWGEVCAMISIVYLEADVLDDSGSEDGTEDSDDFIEWEDLNDF